MPSALLGRSGIPFLICFWNEEVSMRTRGGGEVNLCIRGELASFPVAPKTTPFAVGGLLFVCPLPALRIRTGGVLSLQGKQSTPCPRMRKTGSGHPKRSPPTVNGIVLGATGKLANSAQAEKQTETPSLMHKLTSPPLIHILTSSFQRQIRKGIPDRPKRAVGKDNLTPPTTNPLIGPDPPFDL